MTGGIGVIGAGAFGTALAVALAPPAGAGGPVTLWARDADHADAMLHERENARRLPCIPLPATLRITADIATMEDCDVLLLAVPMQQMTAFADQRRTALEGRALVACSKGIDLETGRGPAATLAALLPGQAAALLTGPSFAADIARGLPTALTLACADADLGARLQRRLATPVLRLYRSADVAGAELGGALKNVVAIAAGIVIGAGLGDSARAALMTRGQAEITRLAVVRGAQPDTLQGLSGLGDLVLTCTSEKSRNYRFGLALGRGETPEAGATVEGVATARAMARIAATDGPEMPVAQMVAAILDGSVTIAQATETLLARPLKEE